MIDVYTDATPNGLKVSIGLKEMGLEYKVHRVFLGGEQLTPEFTALNPNNKIPVLSMTTSWSPSPARSSSIWPRRPANCCLRNRERGSRHEMVFFQMASLGPMLGQLFVFRGSWQNKAPDVRTATSKKSAASTAC